MLLGKHQVSSAVVWADDFDDGNYDGWNVLNGTWSASSNALIATEGVGQHEVNNIYFPSNVNYGNFSFDFFKDSSITCTHYYVGVHGYDMRETGVLNVLAYFGIYLQITGDSTLQIIRSWNNVGDEIAAYTAPETFDGWYHIDMIVMSNHSIHVYLEGELVIDTTSLTVFDQSECFLVIAPDNGGIDNVVITDEEATTSTDTTSTTTEPTTTPTQSGTPMFDEATVLIITVGGILIVVIAIVILKKR
jgi:hypothetical protein